MRSRTELVTTTFIDSEEEQTESDDSEEDWRPESSRNGKKRQTRGKRRNKRKATTASRLLAKKKMVEMMKEAEDEDSDEDSCQKFYAATESTTFTAGAEQGAQLKKSDEQPTSDDEEAFNLYLYKKDLDKDYKNNSHLCLWRRDGSSLLQKYIRVKTNNCEEFIFTSSSVYSSWDERRRKDFATVTVKSLEDNNRRVTLQNPECVHALAEEAAKRKLLKSEGLIKDEDNSANEMLDSQEEDGDYDDDEDEEISGEDDINSAKTSDGDNEYSGGEEGSTNEGASCS